MKLNLPQVKQDHISMQLPPTMNRPTTSRGGVVRVDLLDEDESELNRAGDGNDDAHSYMDDEGNMLNQLSDNDGAQGGLEEDEEEFKVVRADEAEDQNEKEDEDEDPVLARMEHSFKLVKSRKLNNLTINSYFLNPHKRQAEIQEATQAAYQTTQFYLYGGCEKVADNLLVHSMLKQNGIWNGDESLA